MRFLRFLDRVLWLCWTLLFLTAVALNAFVYFVGSALYRLEHWLDEFTPIAKTVRRLG